MQGTGSSDQFIPSRVCIGNERLVGQVAAEDKLDVIVKVSPSILFLEIARKDNNKGLNSTDLVSSDED